MSKQMVALQTQEALTLPSKINVSYLIEEKQIHGHVHIDELYLTYQPLCESLKSTYGDSKERDFWCVQVGISGVRARIYFRYFPEIKLLNLDWIYIPKSLRRKNLSAHLLRVMVEHFSDAKSVHLLLAHGNLRAFQEGAQKSIEEKVRATPTTRQLAKLGFTRLEFANFLSFPKDGHRYPEIVISRETQR